jgi:hypothetical protein
MNRITPDLIQKAKDVEQLEKYCRNLKLQLYRVKTEIVNILSEEIACSKENCALKIHISDLKNQLPVDEELKDIPRFQSSQDDLGFDRSQEMSVLIENSNDVVECARTHDSDVAGNKSVSEKQVTEMSTVKGIEMRETNRDNDIQNLIGCSEKQTDRLVTDEGDDSNKKEKFYLPGKLNEHSSTAKSSSSSSVLQLDDSSKRWKTEEETCVEDITLLQERCCELENSLELLRQVGPLLHSICCTPADTVHSEISSLNL